MSVLWGVVIAVVALALVLFVVNRIRARKPSRIAVMPSATRSWHDTAELLAQPGITESPLIAAPPVPPAPVPAALTVGRTGIGFIDLTEVEYPPYKNVGQDEKLHPGEKWPDGTHMPTAAQSRAARQAGIIRAVHGDVADPAGNKPNLLPLSLTRVSDEDVRAALEELGLKSLDEIEHWGDVMHLRAYIGQGWGAAGNLGAYAPNSLRGVRERRAQRRARGEKIGFQ
jgi:hypothetical protein